MRRGVSAAGCAELDCLRQCAAAGLDEHLSAYRSGVKMFADDLFGTPLDQAEIDFKNEGGETYICGNPPYLGLTWQTNGQKADLQAIFAKRAKNWKSLDYVTGWFMKAADYITKTQAAAAFVSTNSICQEQHVPILWPLLFSTGNKITFAHTSFKWANLASHNAGMTVVIVGLSSQIKSLRHLYSIAYRGKGDIVDIVKEVEHINVYLVPGPNVMVEKLPRPLGEQAEMTKGTQPTDSDHLLLSHDEVQELGLKADQSDKSIRKILGSAEFIRGLERFCIWVGDKDVVEINSLKPIAGRLQAVKKMRLGSTKAEPPEGH